jgi:hypothetical protein
VREVCERYNIAAGDAEGMRQLIRLNLRRLSTAMCAVRSGNCEIRVIDHRMPTGYFIADREQNHGVMHVEIYLLDKMRCPLFVLSRQGGDRVWYDNFVDDFESMWVKARIWTPPSFQQTT